MQKKVQVSIDNFKKFSLRKEEQIQLKGGNGNENNTDDIVTEEEIIN